MTNILFICKWNRFRSKIAEAVFKKYNKKPKYKAKSAGIIRGHPIDLNQKKIAKEMGLKINNPPRGISTALLKWQDIIVIVADNVPGSLFKNMQKKHSKKIIVLKIKDEYTNDERAIKNKIKQIEKKVKNFVKRLR